MSAAHLQEHPGGEPWVGEVDLDEAPTTVAWEVTRACVFSCAHCRAGFQRRPDPGELTTDEGYRLLDRLTEFGSPTLVFTGGDPMTRPDLLDLVAYADEVGLRCTLAPRATTWPTKQRLRLAALAGVIRVDLGLEGPCPEIHDILRKGPGSWDRTMTILRDAEAAGLGRRVSTTVTTHNVHVLPDMVDLLRGLGAVEWNVAFLVPADREQERSMISPEEHERVLAWLQELCGAGDVDVSVAAAPMYRRVAAQHRSGERATGARIYPEVHTVDDGRGFLFVSHLGDIRPSGFLPFAAGNVRTEDVVDVYRERPLFRGLRDSSRLSGKCGVCEFRSVCGGHRGRAYAVTGDVFGSDPACSYVPQGWAETAGA